MGRKDLLETLVGLHEAGRVMGSTLDGVEIGRRMLQILDRTLAPTASIVHLHDDSGELRMLSHLGLQDSCADASEVVESARRRAVETKTRQSLEVDEGLAALFVPLRAQSTVVGLVEVYGPPLERESGEFLSSLCAQAAIALDNSRLYDKLLDHEQRLQYLVDRMVRVQEDERQRVAHEIHDGLTQTLIAINHHLQAYSRDFAPQDEEGLGRLERILQLAHSAVEESRRITFGLRPTVLEDFGVAVAIRSEVEALNEQGMHIYFTDALGEERLPEVVEITLYRIVQEALSNVRKHARVDSANVVLERDVSEIRLSISDQGVGFEPRALPNSDGLGLVGMRERAELIGGTFKVDSAVQGGTGISVSAPLAAGEEERG